MYNSVMKVYFWGTRGSLPASVTAKAVRDKVSAALKEALVRGLRTETGIDQFIEESLPFHLTGSYGSNTSCVEIRGGEEYIVCDAGTGIRDFGNYLMTSSGKSSSVINIFLSHLHWDHIQGFPFFIPAYIPGNKINIFGYHPNMESSFYSQQQPPYFPVTLDQMKADMRFTVLDLNRVYNIGGFKVRGLRQNHPGDSYGFRFERDGRSIVYSTDSEHQENFETVDSPFISFFRGADLLIFDAQYSFVESEIIKAQWGHSSNILGVEMAVASYVKRLCLFHNEPVCDDRTLNKLHDDTRAYLAIHRPMSNLIIDLAYDGLEISL